MLPRTKNFEEILRSCRDHETHDACSIVVHASDPNDADDRELRLWYKPSELPLDAVLRKLASFLRANGHPHDDLIALTLLFAACQMPGWDLDPYAVLDVLSANIAPVTVRCRVVLPRPGDIELKLGDFVLSRPDVAQIALDDARNRTRRMVLDTLSGRQMIAREIETNILNWPSAAASLGLRGFHARILGLVSVQDYFLAVAHNLFDQFAVDLESQQSILAVFGAPVIEATALSSHESTERICTFALPQCPAVAWSTRRRSVPIEHENFADACIQARKLFGEDLSLDGASVVAEPIRAAISMAFEGMKHVQSLRRNDGFIHVVFALDLLISDKGASSETFTSRGSALVCAGTLESYDEQRRIMKRIYDERSRYVHGAQPPAPQSLDIAIAALQCIVRCAIRAARMPGFGHESWKRNIDYLAASYASGRLPAAADRAVCGLAC